MIKKIILKKQISKIWKTYAPQYYWGDPLDARFHLCKELNKLHNKKILDIGCNIGIVLNSADDSNIKEGFDLDKKAISIAKKINNDYKLNAKFYVQDVFKSNIKKNSFDVILFINMIEVFLPNERIKIINKLSQYLKKGGTLYLTTPNGNNSYYKNKSKLKYPELKKLLEKNYNFEIEGWNPLPIQLGHIFKFIPGWKLCLESCMRNNFRKNKCVSFYVKATRK
jgi:2-polyprenyl-3-methyl-5-hydroxy-6-metoxy-1,4-benzoquinol methylase